MVSQGVNGLRFAEIPSTPEASLTKRITERGGVAVGDVNSVWKWDGRCSEGLSKPPHCAHRVQGKRRGCVSSLESAAAMGSEPTSDAWEALDKTLKAIELAALSFPSDGFNWKLDG